MILTDIDLYEEIAKKNIIVTPLAEGAVGTNSIDVHLSKFMCVYEPEFDGLAEVIDAAKPCNVRYFEIPDNGIVLMPGEIYLASTLEYTETRKHVPVLEGKSSVGRLGINIHATAGFGDLGYRGHWTLEIFVVQPVRVYAGMPIGQIAYHEPKAAPETNYMDRETSTYTNDIDPKPQPSRLWKKLAK
jgi:dCTP deaminase